MGHVLKAYSRANLRDYRSDTSGNVIMLTALLLPVLLVFAGVAIDTQYTITQKARVQQAMDSAILAGTLARQKGATQQDVQTEVRAYFTGLVSEEDNGLVCEPVDILFSEVDQGISGSIRCEQETKLVRLIGMNEMPFNASSVSSYSIGDVDISFVFDVSGSMNNESRLSLLKVAAHDAIDILLPPDSSSDGSVRLAIATYNNSVNAGPYAALATEQAFVTPASTSADAENHQALYLRQHLIDPSSDERYFYYEEPGECIDWGRRNCREYAQDLRVRYFKDVSTPATCVHERIGAQAATDIAPGPNAYLIAGNPEWDFDDSSRKKERGFDEVDSGDADESDGAFDLSYAECQSSEPVPLTDNRSVLKTHVDSLVAGGGTAGHIGLSWGWYLVSPNWANVWPVDSAPLAYDDRAAMKAVILMTDGDFNSEHPAAADDSFGQAMNLCDQMKATATNLTIYTVGFQVPDTVQRTGDGRTILQYCATDPEKAFDAANGDELKAAYRAIAQDITELRIKQ